VKRFRSICLLLVLVSLLPAAVYSQSGLSGSVQLRQVAQLTASDSTAADYIGTAVAVSGNTVVVGHCYLAASCESEQGSAYVFVEPSSRWADMTQTAELKASDGYPGDGFGMAVAISANTIVVGALPVSSTGLPQPSKVYVFAKPAGGWRDMTETAQLIDGTYKVDSFGSAVAIDGNTIVVGAEASQVGVHKGQGAAYVFVRPVSGWKSTSTYNAQLVASDGVSNCSFGLTVAISGTTIVTGAPFRQNRAGPGEAYVFVRPSSGWTSATETAILKRANAGIYDFFGGSVAISENVITVGAPHAVVPYTQGAVDVFVMPASGWVSTTETVELAAPPGDVDATAFGRTVAIYGVHIFAGSNDGFFEYIKPKIGWQSTTDASAHVTAGDPNNQLGVFSISTTGHNVVAGAPFQTVNGNSDQGVVYVFAD
jgi:FG-GAP repeat